MRGILSEIGRSVASALGVVVDGLRLFWHHWPVLLVIFLAGAAAREGVLWASFATSKVSPLASSLIVPLAPLATLVALILMLRHLLPSLQHVEGAHVADSMSTRLKVVASALVPFLALYAAQGYLRLDTRRYLNEVYADEDRSTNWLIGESMGARTTPTSTAGWSPSRCSSPSRSGGRWTVSTCPSAAPSSG